MCLLSLVQIAFDDNSGDEYGTSKLTFVAEADTDYFAVLEGSYSGDCGKTDIQFEEVSATYVPVSGRG